MIVNQADDMLGHHHTFKASFLGDEGDFVPKRESSNKPKRPLILKRTVSRLSD